MAKLEKGFLKPLLLWRRCIGRLAVETWAMQGAVQTPRERFAQVGAAA